MSKKNMFWPRSLAQRSKKFHAKQNFGDFPFRNYQKVALKYYPRTLRSQRFMKTSWNQISWNDFWIRTLISYLHSFRFHASKNISKLCREICHRISKLLCILMQFLEYNFWFPANRNFGHKPAKKFTLLVLFESPMRPESFARCILGNFLYSSSKKPAMHKSFTQETL